MSNDQLQWWYADIPVKRKPGFITSSYRVFFLAAAEDLPAIGARLMVTEIGELERDAPWSEG